jgi:hypothetical protein
LNFCALWKKQTTLPSLAYDGIPYQVFGERAGARALPLVLGADRCMPFLAGFLSVIANHLRALNESR